jgi:hypothetical protein
MSKNAAHLTRAAGAETIFGAFTAAEPLHRVGKLFDRPHLIADENHRDDAEKQSRAENPGQKQRSRARLHAVAERAHLQHAAFDRHADNDLIARAAAIVPNLAAKVFAQRAREIAVRHRTAAAAARAFKLSVRFHLDLQTQRLQRQPTQILKPLRRRIALIKLDQQRHVRRHRLAHALRRRLPMIVEEDERNDQLQHRRRRDDNQQCAPIETLG